jgi:CxxC-x17-CxxC domain-containing protein
MSPHFGSENPIRNEAGEDSGEFQDTKIDCIDCGQSFVWSAGEQLFFRDKNLRNPPKRCKNCKKAKNERLAAIAAAQNAGIKQRIEVAVHCARCSSYTTVPFYPSQGRPVLCRSCFLEQNPGLIGSDS